MTAPVDSILLNIGNTRSAVASGCFPNGVIDYFPTTELLSRWQLPDGAHAVVSCVVPAIRKALAERYGSRIHFIGTADFAELDFSGYDTATLGTDRISNAAAAHQLLPGGAFAVFDCGTALNSVCVDANGHFCGGVILPGRETALRSLSASAAQLPEYAVDARHDFNALSKNTRSAILNGVDIGILGAAEAIIRRIRQNDGFRDCTVWFTGGDAPFFAEYLPAELEVRQAPVPLTLYGIRMAAERLEAKQ